MSHEPATTQASRRRTGLRSALVPTIFTRIIDGEIPGTFVWRDDRCVVFMSINPLAVGHALVVPIDEIDHWVDAPADLVTHLFDVTRIIGVAQRDAFSCERVGVMIAGYEVPHMHIHVIPTSSMAELNFANAATSVDPADLEAAAARIRAALPS
jgi:histidine triad (HIT) family protein